MTLDINTRNVYYDSCFVDFFCVHSWEWAWTSKPGGVKKHVGRGYTTFN